MHPTWLSELTTSANERPFLPEEIEKYYTYLDTVPLRVRVSEELEELEDSLVAELTKAAKPRFGDAFWFSNRFIKDTVETLRVVAQAVLLDEHRVIDDRLIFHLLNLCDELDIPSIELRDLYRLLREQLHEKMAVDTFTLVSPVLDRLLSALDRPEGFFETVRDSVSSRVPA